MDPAPLDWAAVVPCEWAGGPRPCTKAGQIIALDGQKLCSNHHQQHTRRETKANPTRPLHTQHPPTYAPRIIFISPRAYQSWEALSAGYLKSWCDQPYDLDGSPRPDGIPNATWLFRDRWFDGFDDTVAAAATCDFVLMTAASSQYDDALALARAIRALNPAAKLIVGGYHPTALPGEVAADLWDFVVLREGEESALAILTGNLGPWNQRSPLSPKLIESDLLTEAQLSAFTPDRHYIRQERNLSQAEAENDGERIAAVFATRGCSHQCSFCSSKQVFSRINRRRTYDSVWSEVTWLLDNFGITYLKFSDDTISLNKKWTLGLLRSKIDHSDARIRDIPWGANHRCDNTSDEMAELMAESNCDTLWIGFESGSPRMLKTMMKNITPEQIAYTFDTFRKVGIKRRSYIIVGVPGEDTDTIRETRDFVRVIKPDTVGVTNLVGFPGAMEYWWKVPHDDCDSGDCHTCAAYPGSTPDMMYGQYVEQFSSWSAFDEYNNFLTRTEALTNTQLRIIQRYLLDDFSVFAETSAHAFRGGIRDEDYDPTFLYEAWGETPPER